MPVREGETCLDWEGGVCGMMSGYIWVLLCGSGIQEPLQKADIRTLAERSHDEVGVRDDSSR